MSHIDWLVAYQLIAKAVGVFWNPNLSNLNRTTTSTTNQQKPPYLRWQVMRLLGLWSKRLMQKTIFQAVFGSKSVPEEDIFRVPKKPICKIELKTLETKNGRNFNHEMFLFETDQISTKKPHPPRNFFWYIPWDFPWKTMDA